MRDLRNKRRWLRDVLALTATGSVLAPLFFFLPVRQLRAVMSRVKAHGAS